MPLGIMPGEWDWMNLPDPFGRTSQYPNVRGFPRGGGLLGGTSTPTGIFGRVNRALEPYGGMGGLGAQLLANSGRANSFGEALGTSMLGGQEQAQSQQNDALRREYMQSQIERMRQPQRADSPFGAIDPSKFTRESISQFMQSGNYGDLVPVSGGMNNIGNFNPGDYTPTSFAKFMRSKDPNDLQRYVTPANPTVQIVGGVPTVVAPDRSGGTANVSPLSTLEAELGAARQKAGATAGGKVEGETQAGAARDLPKAEDRAQVLMTNLDRMRKHPGLKSAIGIKGASSLYGFKDTPIAGSAGADFVALVDQTSGEVFLQAFQELKGGGHITEIEGAKAEQAVARIRNRDQSESGYRQALDDLEQIVKRGLERKRQAAGGATSGGSQQQPKRVRVDAQGNVIGN